MQAHVGRARPDAWSTYRLREHTVTRLVEIDWYLYLSSLRSMNVPTPSRHVEYLPLGQLRRDFPLRA